MPKELEVNLKNQVIIGKIVGSSNMNICATCGRNFVVGDEVDFNEDTTDVWHKNTNCIREIS